MTSNELLNRVMAGRLILVGEFRNGRVETKASLDRGSGLAIQTSGIVYAVECGSAFGTVLIHRAVPADVTNANDVNIGLIKGRRYAFELNRLVRNGDFVNAHLAFREPEPIDDGTGDATSSPDRP